MSERRQNARQERQHRPMAIKTMSELQNAYRALRQVVEEHPDSEAMKRKFDVLYGEFMERRAKAIRERDSRIPMIDLKSL